MKMTIISVYLGLFVLASDGRGEQGALSDADDISQHIREDAVLAASKANVRFDDLLLKAFTESAVSQADAVAQVYSTVSKEERVERMAQYLIAKAKLGALRNLDDFHWGYILHNIKYVSLQLDSPAIAKLMFIEGFSGKYAFSEKGRGIKPGTDIFVPAAIESGGRTSATFKLGTYKALWTGDPSTPMPKLKIVAAMTSQGCEIFVNSEPQGAAVYFNREKWYQLTNTSSVREPGVVDVTIRLKDRKEWHEKRKLDAGDTWTIQAELEKQ